MKTYTTPAGTKVTAEDIDNICDAAFYSGITYWARNLEVVKKPTEPGATALSEYLTHGGVLAITDEEGVRQIITLDTVLEGIGLCTNHDFENYDAADADSVIQYGVFGELVYG